MAAAVAALSNACLSVVSVQGRSVEGGRWTVEWFFTPGA